MAELAEKHAQVIILLSCKPAMNVNSYTAALSCMYTASHTPDVNKNSSYPTIPQVDKNMPIRYLDSTIEQTRLAYDNKKLGALLQPAALTHRQKYMPNKSKNKNKNKNKNIDRLSDRTQHTYGWTQVKGNPNKVRCTKLKLRTKYK